MTKSQRFELEGYLARWAEWSMANSSGFTTTQWDSSPSGEFGSVPLFNDGIKAIEDGMRSLGKEDRNLYELIKWLWLQYNVNRGQRWIASQLNVSERTYRNWRDRAYLVLWESLKGARLVSAA